MAGFEAGAGAENVQSVLGKDELGSTAMEANSNCAKCEGKLEEGFLTTPATMGTTVIWISGQPEGTRLTGLKTKGRQQLRLRTLRCAVCGYIESYADRPLM
jgi:hypothetical protein